MRFEKIYFVRHLQKISPAESIFEAGLILCRDCRQVEPAGFRIPSQAPAESLGSQKARLQVGLIFMPCFTLAKLLCPPIT